MLEQPANFPIAAFVQTDPQPRMATLRVTRLDPIEARGSILELDTLSKLIENRHAGRSPQTHAVLAFDLARGMHQPVRELAVVGEQQQSRGVHVESADDDPSTPVGRRQSFEHGRAILRITARGHFADGLVIDQDLGSGRAPVQVERFPVEADLVVDRPAISEARDLAVDRDPSGADPLLDAAARSVPRTCEKLLQSFVHLNHGT